MPVTITNPLLWNDSNTGTWDGILPESVFSSDGLNLNPGFSYIQGSSIFGSTGGQMYWDYILVLLDEILEGGGAAGGGSPSITAQIANQQSNQLIIEQAVAVYVEMVAPMLTEEKKNLYKLAGINVSKKVKKQAAEEVKVIIENLDVKSRYGVENYSDLKPKMNITEFVQKILNNKKVKK